MGRVPAITWVMTIAECTAGFWVASQGWQFVGGIIVGLAVGTQLARISCAIRDGR